MEDGAMIVWDKITIKIRAANQMMLRILHIKAYYNISVISIVLGANFAIVVHL